MVLISRMWILMSDLNLKGILKRNINHYSGEKLGDHLCEILNEHCGLDSYWYFEDNSLNIDIDIDEQDKVIKIIEDLVGCSYINEYSDVTALLTLSFTLSTLIEKLNDVNEYGYEPVKMDRFYKHQNKDDSYRGKHVYIIDHKMLANEMFTKGYADNGIVFTAASPSEWVNNEIVDEVLKLLNTERSYTQMIDNCIEKELKK